MRTKELLLMLLLTTLPIAAIAQYYSGNVGQTISLPLPSTPAGYKGIMDSSYSSDSKYLSVYQGTSSVKILSYFSGTETVRCDFTCYKEVYSAGRLYYYYGTSTAYYYIRCSSSAPGLVLSASPDGGQVGKGTTVRLSVTYNGSEVSDCDIYYTLNGNTPTKNSKPYRSGISIDSDCTLKAIAYKEGYKTSEVLTEKYTVVDITLTADPPGGNVTKGTVVHLYSNKSNASIRYTLNGSKPTLGDPVYKESEGIVINQACTLKATAKINGANNSIISTPVMEWRYTVSSPRLSLTATPSGGKVSKGTVVKLSAKSDGTTVGADIYYTLNGTTPTKSSTRYTSSGITIDSDCTLRAIAYKSGFETSSVLISSYTIREDIVITAKSYTRVYGDANPVFEYLTSGGAITSGEPTITCSANETSPVGTYDIIIGRGTIENDNVEFEKGTLTVTKAPLTITADDKQIRQGESLPEFTATYSGFKNNETESVLTKKPVFSCPATQSSAPGLYEISVSGAEAMNYSFTYGKGTLAINSADLIIVTARSCSREYGDSNPRLEFTVSGGALQGEPDISCNATKGSDVGIYDIIVSQGSISNPDVQYVNGKLTVTAAPLEISAGSYTMRQGDPLPQFNVSYKGFKNGEGEEVLLTPPRIECDVDKDSAPGTYSITVSGAAAKNYAIGYVSGTLTILPGITSDELSVSMSLAGSLPTETGSSAWKTIRSLTVSGQVNGTDIRFIRRMLQEGRLEELDLHDARIVSGGESYDIHGLSRTSDDVIGESMFYDCRNLKKIRLPSDTRRIEGYAFFGCSRLKQIELPGTCVAVGDYAIAFCDSLTSIRIPAGILRIGESAFTYCSSLSTVYSEIVDINDAVSSDYYSSPFEGIAEDCLWHVPKGAKKKYTSLSWWGRSWWIVDDLDTSTSAIEAILNRTGKDEWHTLRGTRTGGVPTAAGIYIHNGKKVMIK